jgi:hypothetical protein
MKFKIPKQIGAPTLCGMHVQIWQIYAVVCKESCEFMKFAVIGDFQMKKNNFFVQTEDHLYFCWKFLYNIVAIEKYEVYFDKKTWDRTNYFRHVHHKDFNFN